MRPTTYAVLAMTAALIHPAAVATAMPSRSDIGSVPASVAAKQLRNGMPATYTKTWATAKLSSLQVRPDGPMTGYSRELFPHWRDADTWGWTADIPDACDVRDAALIRDGQGVTYSTTCNYLEGTWIDPYGARKYDSSADIDSDHLVPLGQSWRSGAATWSEELRTRFANDPLVVVSSYDRLNSAKGDRGPESWKPPLKASWCNYGIRWVAIKSTYKLSVNAAEKTALTSMLKTCRA